MKIWTRFLGFLLIGMTCGAPGAFAWGRHDLITQITLDTPLSSTPGSRGSLLFLNSFQVTPEPIEKAAPDLVQKVIPKLERWSARYFKNFDQRYSWSAPKARYRDPKKELLWSLEDNIQTPLAEGNETTAAEVLVHYVNEPDGQLDEALDRPPYVGRLRTRMSYFYGDDVHTHAFRHYYVPSSLLPPILTPRGLAPYRAELYSRLAKGAFATGHTYWGFRFLAWSIHYIQDVSQPWHTVFLPNLSFLSFSKTEMKRQVSALHYLTEAFADSWMENNRMLEQPVPGRALAQVSEILDDGTSKIDPKLSSRDPWYVSKLAESVARKAHSRASELADLAREFFHPVVDHLGTDLKPTISFISFGGRSLVSKVLDFSGKTDGAGQFLAPIWETSFNLVAPRDRLGKIVGEQLNSAVVASRLVIQHVLGGISGSSKV